MAHVAHANSHALDARPTGLLARVRHSLAEYRKFRRTVAELDALNDRELADLGISRTDIRFVAREAVYGA